MWKRRITRHLLPYRDICTNPRTRRNNRIRTDIDMIGYSYAAAKQNPVADLGGVEARHPGEFLMTEANGQRPLPGDAVGGNVAQVVGDEDG